MSQFKIPPFGIPDDLKKGPGYDALSAAPANWGMSFCDVQALRDAGGDGEGELIAILDTGCDDSHPEFAGKIVDARSFVSGESVKDGNGHGTHCGGTAAGKSSEIGVANMGRLAFGKCLSNSGSGIDSWITPACEWAIQIKATVVSMSIGGPGFLEGMEPLFLKMIAAGIVPVVAAGNERQRGGLVRSESSAIVVAAFDSSGRIASFSNPGRTEYILSSAAPGVDIVSARAGGGYRTMSGTSMATPFVSGFVADVQSARTKKGLRRLTAQEFKTLFRKTSVDAGTPGLDRDFGPGMVDGRLAAFTLLADPPPVTP